MENTTPAQEIYLTMIQACGQWNSFDGQRIAKDLRANLRVWRSAILTRVSRLPKGAIATELKHHVNLIALRDLPKNHVNLDTLFIIPEPREQDRLEHLAAGWSPDEMKWFARPEGLRALGSSKFQFAEYTEDESRFLFQAWWD